jgi:hypothetical protein
MSDQRYAPPSATLSEPSQHRGTGRIDLAEAFREAWGTTWANFGLLLGAAIVFTLASLLSVVTVIGIVAVLPVLFWGQVRFILNVLDGNAEIGDVFSGFSNYVPNLVATLGAGALFLGIAILGQVPQWIGQATHLAVLSLLGALISLGWSVGVMPRLYFVWYYVVEQDMGPTDAIRASWAATADQKLICFVLGVVTGLVMMVGFLFLIVGVIPAAMVAALMQAVAYRQLQGR